MGRLDFTMAGDELGDLSFSPKSLEEQFGVVTVRAQNSFVHDSLEELGALLAEEMEIEGSLAFHAARDGPSTRADVLRLIASYPMTIEATIAKKSDIPDPWRKKPTELFASFWAQHLAWTLPEALGYSNRIRLTLAEMQPHTARLVFRRAVGGALLLIQAPHFMRGAGGAAGGLRAGDDVASIMWGVQPARESRAIQVADYCAGALRQKLRGTSGTVDTLGQRMVTPWTWLPGISPRQILAWKAADRARWRSSLKSVSLRMVYESLERFQLEDAIVHLEDALGDADSDPGVLFGSAAEVGEAAISRQELRLRAFAAVMKAAEQFGEHEPRQSTHRSAAPGHPVQRR